MGKQKRRGEIKKQKSKQKIYNNKWARRNGWRAEKKILPLWERTLPILCERVPSHTAVSVSEYLKKTPKKETKEKYAQTYFIKLEIGLISF